MRILLLIFLLLPSIAWGVDVIGQGAVAGNNLGAFTMLEWDANTELDLAGYKLYYSCDRVYPPYNGTQSWRGASPVDVGNRTSYTLTGMNASCEYWSAAVTAYNTTGLESGYSNIVTWEFANDNKRHLSVGALAHMAENIYGTPEAVGSVSGIGDIWAGSNTAYPGYLGAVAGIGDLIATGKALSYLTSQGSTGRIGDITAEGLIRQTFGQGAIAGAGRLRTLNAMYVPLKVVKFGNGSVYVSGDGIDCGSDCETTVAKNSNYTLTWSKDATESDVYSWGNACLSAERSTTCTVPTDAAGQRMYVEQGGYAIASIVSGSFKDPICRVGRGTAQVTLQRSLQLAYTAVANGQGSMPIDCIAEVGDGPLLMNTSIDVELVGGWTDLFPGQITPGVPTNINGGLTVKFGSFTIGSYNGGGAVVIK